MKKTTQKIKIVSILGLGTMGHGIRFGGCERRSRHEAETLFVFRKMRFSIRHSCEQHIDFSNESDCGPLEAPSALREYALVQSVSYCSGGRGDPQ